VIDRRQRKVYAWLIVSFVVMQNGSSICAIDDSRIIANPVLKITPQGDRLFFDSVFLRLYSFLQHNQDLSVWGEVGASLR
jgi:hypothetical protein